MVKNPHNVLAKQQFNTLQKGYHLSGNNSPLIHQFGCSACSWRDSPVCPHGFKFPQKHSNGICSQRVMYIQRLFQDIGSEPRALQVEEATRLRLLLDKLTMDMSTENILSPELAKLSKNLNGLLDKMRRQDEGIKMQGDIDVTVHDFRKVVDAQAKAIGDKSILEVDAEYDELDKRDNSTGRVGPEEKV